MKELARLTALVLALALVISRLGLVAHELLGHGLVASMTGGDVNAWSLHWFGGGWLGFTRARGATGVGLYAVEMGGIAVELLLGLACAAAARVTKRRSTSPGPRTLALALGGAAWALVLHAGWYLAAGTYHGFGDGWVLHRRLGDPRLAIVIPVAVAIVVGAAIAGARVGRALRAHVPGSPRRQLAIAAGALALALGAHAALTLTELQLRTDRPYQRTMRTAAQRAVERELATLVATSEVAGRPMDAREVAAARRKLERQHRQLPVGPILIALIGIAAAGGIARSRPAEVGTPPSNRVLVAAAAACAASIALVIVLDRLSP
jgi:hypothetical protein